MTRQRADISGLRFHHLVAIRPLEKRMWEFECDCGRLVSLRSGNVLYGATKSCGCLKTRNGVGNTPDRPFFDRLSWDCKSISAWSKHYDTTPSEIMKRLQRDKAL